MAIPCRTREGNLNDLVRSYIKTCRKIEVPAFCVRLLAEGVSTREIEAVNYFWFTGRVFKMFSIKLNGIESESLFWFTGMHPSSCNNSASRSRCNRWLEYRCKCCHMRYTWLRGVAFIFALPQRTRKNVGKYCWSLRAVQVDRRKYFAKRKTRVKTRLHEPPLLLLDTTLTIL